MSPAMPRCGRRASPFQRAVLAGEAEPAVLAREHPADHDMSQVAAGSSRLPSPDLYRGAESRFPVIPAPTERPQC
jgi:hypothetical protein